MNILFECPTCKAEIEADETLFGTIRDCPGCEQDIEVPAAHIGPGVELGGFRIQKKIGKGGMGEVFLAEQLSMGRTVALKILPPEMTSNKDAVQRFLKEARMSARLEHPNIVTVLDAGEDYNYYYLAMYFVDGYTLEDRLDDEKTIPEKEALGCAKKVLMALSHAWEHHNILHRDIKPANVMIDKYGEVKILDMGLAKDILEDSHLTISGTIVGTPYYMSPEQAKSKRDLDFRSDLYSVGATLYHLLCGAPPFEGDSVVTILTQHVLEEVPPIQTRNPDISDECATLMEIILAKNPTDRYDSYEEAISDIDRVIDGKPPVAKQPPAKKQDKKKGGPAIKRKKSNLKRPTRPAPDPSAAVTIDSPVDGAASRSGAHPPSSNKAVKIVIASVLIGVLLMLAAAMALSIGPGDDPGGQQVAGNNDSSDPTPKGDDDDDDDSDPDNWNNPKNGTKPKKDWIAKELKSIQRFQKDNPFKYQDAIERYQKIAPDSIGTPHRQTILEEITKLRAKQVKALQTVMKGLKNRVEGLIAAGKPEEAAKVLREYDGPFAEITRVQRDEIAREILRESRKKEAAKQQKRAEAMTYFEDEFEGIGKRMIKQDFKSARRDIEKLKRAKEIDPVRERFDPMLKLALDVCDMEQLVLDSFKESIGKEISVRLKGDRETLKINGVEEGVIKASRKVMRNGKHRGWLGMSLSYRELSPSEKVRRIGEINSDAKLAMKGILYVEIDRNKDALESFRKMKSELGEGLSASIGGGLDIAASRLMKLAGLPEREEASRLMGMVARKNYTQTQKEKIREEAATVLRRYGDESELDEYRQLLHKLAHLDMPNENDPVRRPNGNTTKFPAQGKGKIQRVKTADYIKPDRLGKGADNAIRLQKGTVEGKGVPLEVFNTLNMKFRLIPSGAHWGYPGNAPGKLYYMGKFEVTQAQWKKIFPNHKFSNANDDHPADNLAFPDVLRFIEKLCEREQLPEGTYRLPTAEEWMYACRAGTHSKFYFGDDVDNLHRHGNYLDSSAPDEFRGRDLRRERDRRFSDRSSGIARVGSYLPNPWGLHDMQGNVWEYVKPTDEFAGHYDAKGGSWLDPKERFSPTGTWKIPERLRFDPHMPHPFGFRVVLEAPKLKKRRPDDPDDSRHKKPRDDFPRRPLRDRFPRR